MDRPWSVELFEERLIAAFRDFQGRGVFASEGTLRLLAGQRIHGYELIALTQQVLGSRSQASKALLGWARCQAYSRSFGEFCAEMGWNRSTAEENRRRGSRDVVSFIVGV